MLVRCPVAPFPTTWPTTSFVMITTMTNGVFAIEMVMARFQSLMVTGCLVPTHGASSL
ncbi:hypothetical protein [Salipiger sp. CCB-MM3]|uniref:hypothetical protein n=1 Tax=Salipiger sp. CCB-MM3 TaxID=1792508 RepID=UPI00187DCB44|nr:hypothetical protein [Salipiger sp. CCB-MM3]